MQTVTIHQAKTHLSRLVAQVQLGGELIICRGREPVAKLVPITPPRRPVPPVGQPTSEPFPYSDQAFAPLTEDELKAWGLE